MQLTEQEFKLAIADYVLMYRKAESEKAILIQANRELREENAALKKELEEKDDAE